MVRVTRLSGCALACPSLPPGPRGCGPAHTRPCGRSGLAGGFTGAGFVPLDLPLGGRMVPEHPPPPGTTCARRRGWTLARLPLDLVVSPGGAPMALVLRPGPLAEPLAANKPLLPQVCRACGLVHRAGVRQRPCSSRPGHTPLVCLSCRGGCPRGFCFTAPIPAYAREAVGPVAAAGPCSTLRRPPDPPKRSEHGAENVPSAPGPVKAGVSSGSASHLLAWSQIHIWWF